MANGGLGIFDLETRFETRFAKCEKPLQRFVEQILGEKPCKDLLNKLWVKNHAKIC
jgi:hypothetical protein